MDNVLSLTLCDARQLRLRSHLKKDTFVVQKHYFVVYIFIQINIITLSCVIDDDKARE